MGVKEGMKDLSVKEKREVEVSRGKGGRGFSGVREKMCGADRTVVYLGRGKGRR